MTVSDRQKQILRLLAKGLSPKEAGARLRISHSTVKSYLGRVLARNGLKTTTQAVALFSAGQV